MAQVHESGVCCMCVEDQQLWRTLRGRQDSAATPPSRERTEKTRKCGNRYEIGWYTVKPISFEFVRRPGPQTARLVGQNPGDGAARSSWNRPSAPGCGDTSKASASSCSIWGGDQGICLGYLVAVDWVTGCSHSLEEGRRLDVQSGLRKDKVYRSQHCPVRA